MKAGREDGPIETVHIAVEGMHCAGCATAAENVLSRQRGVHGVDISYAAEQGRLRFNPETTDLDTILGSLRGTGYQARALANESEKKENRRRENALLRLLTAAAFGMQVMLLYLVVLYPNYGAGAFAAEEVRRIQYVAWALATPALFIGGSTFFVGAWRALRGLTANMDTLVALGTISAYGYSAYMTVTGAGEAYFDSVVMITTFIVLGRYLEATLGLRARKDIRQLLKLRPEVARRRVDDGWEEIVPGQLQLDDTIMIRSGERVPVDAVVTEGEAEVDGSLVTGESQPVSVGPGSTVLGGTVVTTNAVICRVTAVSNDSRLAQITRVVQQTLSQKPPIQRVADRAAAWFAFGIVGVAVITLGIRLLLGGGLSSALLTSISVLVVACPCALGLATPLALVVSLGRATRSGLIIRNAAALEMAAKVRHIALDKTGTLTEGRMTVARVEPAAGVERDELLRSAATVEQYSEHPIARAIVAETGSLKSARDFVSVRAKGARAVVGPQDETVRVGAREFCGVEPTPDQLQTAAECERNQETVVWIARGTRNLGFLSLRDKPNPTAAPALRGLAQRGIETAVLSGDSVATTTAVAAELGISNYMGTCEPEEKSEHIRQLQADGARVAMVGDGVNDAPALARADLSITNAGGTDVAGETSDIVLARPDLTLLPFLVDLSRRTRRIIAENLGWAFAYNMVSVPLAALGLIRPMLAAVAMACSSLLVVANSLRIRHGKA